jgi:hypothetical protein
MYVGTGLGPTGTVSNSGLVAHLVIVATMMVTTNTPTAAHHFTGAELGGASTTGLVVASGLASV